MGMKYLASSICACGYAGEQLGEAEGGVQEEHGHAGEQLGDTERGVQEEHGHAGEQLGDPEGGVQEEHEVTAYRLH